MFPETVLPPDPGANERAIIERLTQDPLPSWVYVGPGDDAAVLHDGTTLTVDTLVEGVHWNERCSAADVGYKAVAVSVSDLAAMGAKPQWMMLSISVPQPLDPTWMEEFSRGTEEARRQFGVSLIGGDTTRSPVRMVSVSMAGSLVARPLRRSGAKPGDDLWVTGTPGLAGMGYLRASPPAAALELFQRPQPPLAFALALATEGLAHGAMDLSDGLALDLPRFCQASGVGATVDARWLPVHAAFDADPDPLQLQWSAGDDYQLLFAAPPENREKLLILAEAQRISCTRIGAFSASPGIHLRNGEWKPPAFDHFGET